MPTRIEEILTNARDLLADELPSARWDDAKLIRFLNEGYKEAVITNRLLKDRMDFFIEDDVKYISLPDDILFPTRVEYNGQKISFLTHQDLDRQFEESNPPNWWQCDCGPEPLAVVFDLQNRRIGTIYPVLKDICKETYVFSPDAFGVLLTISAVDAATPFGVIVAHEDETICDGDGFVVPPYGVAVEADDRGVLRVFYDKKPGKLDSIDSVIETDSCFDIALKYYVVHMALAADMDTMDNKMSEKYLAMYAAKIEEARKDASMGYTIGDHHTNYKGFM
jgi:hypothetical protein